MPWGDGSRAIDEFCYDKVFATLNGKYCCWSIHEKDNHITDCLEYLGKDLDFHDLVAIMT